MQLPNYWLTRPGTELRPDAERLCDQLWEATLSSGANALIEYSLPLPKWRFLCYLSDECGLALHGSSNAGIQLFEPRQSNDLIEFGRQKAVYAAADGIWAMFFAVADRERFRMSVTNACVRLTDPDGTTAGPFYFFAVSRMALPQFPWRSGTVYILPRVSFQEQPPMSLGTTQVHIAQLASLEPVRPLARLHVEPHDFPFLAQVRGFDDERLAEYAAALQSGTPLPDD